MIVSTGTANGKPAIVLGLTGEDLTSLAGGGQLAVDLDDLAAKASQRNALGIQPRTVVLTYGRTAADLMRGFAESGALTPDSDIHG